MAAHPAESSPPADVAPREAPKTMLPVVVLEETPQGRVLWPLFLVSFAALYLEILLIRWIGTEVRIFAYFQNLALIACFLGFGLGCFYAQRRRSAVLSILAMTALVVLVQSQVSFTFWKGLLNNLTNILSLSRDAVMWGGVLADAAGHVQRIGAETRLLLTWSAILVVVGLLFLLIA